MRRGSIGRLWISLLVFLSLSVLALLIFAALFGPYLPLPDPYAQNLTRSLEMPSSKHWLGTDQFGRDQFSRIVAGARFTLVIGIGAVGFGFLVGSLFGLLAGYFGRWMDALFSRVIDVMLAFPAIILALGVMAVAGPGLGSLILAVGVRSIPVFGRLSRGQTLSLREKEFVQSARAIGCSSARILLRHILPNIANSLIVVGTLQVATSILLGATLTFLGVGMSPEIPEWGSMLNAGRPFMLQHPQLALAPGLILTLVMMALNVVSDYLRDRFDPRLRIGFH